MIGLDTVKNYELSIKEAAQECLVNGQSALEYLKSITSSRLGDLGQWVELRRELLSSTDVHKARPYIEETGVFGKWAEADRTALIHICFDLEQAVAELSLRERLQPYDPTQKIFTVDSSLWHHVRHGGDLKRVHELIDGKAINLIAGSHLASRNGWYFVIDSFLAPLIVTWTTQATKSSQVWIRLNPHTVYKSPPQQLLTEATLRPANPRWLRKLTLHKNSSDGGAYALDPPLLPTGDLERYWEYHVKRVRSLQCSATRRSNGHLSMTIEELSEPKDLDRWLIGRMIHLDTHDGIGTDFNEATLDHIDLAINVYKPEAALRRSSLRLDEGVVENASFRSHLIRADRVPFKILFPFAFFFFESKILLADWARDQFSKIDL